MLDKMDLDKVRETPAVWEKIVHKLRTRAMPPAGRPRPEAPAYSLPFSFPETALDRAAASQPTPGSPAIRRMTRTEQKNAIQDSLGIHIDGESVHPVNEVD